MNAFMRIAERNTPEEFTKTLQRIGVLDENGEYTPKYRFIEEFSHASAV